ncbi:MAG: hypothetical protein C0504_16475 [Candidatus Solibacter sp.]|nr:hypothetical protein [Candidatus Solibacter sp.]
MIAYISAETGHYAASRGFFGPKSTQCLPAVSRTAFDGDKGGAKRARDANFMTFHRIGNFRENPAPAAKP